MITGEFESGVWVCEGHSIDFILSPNGKTVRIGEKYMAQQQEMTSHITVDIDDAIEYQQKHIRLGYDKIS